MAGKLSSNPVEQEVRDLLEGRVRLYRRRDAGKVWHYRIWVKDAKRYMRKSTGTPMYEEARGIAEDAFFDMRARIRNELPVFSKTFKEVYDIAIQSEAQKVERKEMTQGRFKFLKRIAKLYYLPFLGKHQITRITNATMASYWNYRIDFWNKPNSKELQKKHNAMRVSKSPRGTTLHLEKRVVDMVFNKAEELNYISLQQRPRTAPPAKNVTERRPALTMEQWQKMRDFMCNVYRHDDGPKCTEQNRRARNLLYFYCVTMVATGMRVSDMRNVKWENVTRQTDINGRTSINLQVYGKTKQRDVAANDKLYDTLMEWRGHTLNTYTGNKDYVFPNHNGQPLKDLGEVFETMKDKAELTKDYNGVSQDYIGDNITLYSLRHTYATFQIMYLGTSYEDLSKNMGNTPAILQKHYDHVKSSDIAERLSKEIKGARTAEPIDFSSMAESKLVRGVFGLPKRNSKDSKTRKTQRRP